MLVLVVELQELDKMQRLQLLARLETTQEEHLVQEELQAAAEEVPLFRVQVAEADSFQMA